MGCNEDCGSLTGLLLMACSAFFFSLMSLCVHVAGRSLGAFEVLFVRSVFCWLVALAPLLPLGLKRRRRRQQAAAAGTNGGVTEQSLLMLVTGARANRPLLLLRALCGGTTMGLCYFTLTHLPLADASTPIFTSPLQSWVGSHVMSVWKLSFRPVAAA